LGGAKIYLSAKTCSIPARTKSTTPSAILSRKRMGKTRIIAETGAGRMACTATVSAMFGMKCVIYMARWIATAGIERLRMKDARPEVVPVHAGQKTLRKPSTKPCATGSRCPHHPLHPWHRVRRASVSVMVRNFIASSADEDGVKSSNTKSVCPIY